MASFDAVWIDTENFEKGFQNNSNDSGNYCKGQLIGTNRGISAIGWAQYNGGTCPTVTQLKGLTAAQAKQIAKKQYWDNIHGDSFKTLGIAHVVFDMTFGGSSGPLQVRQTINKFKPGAVKEFKSNSISLAEVNLINSFDQKKFFDALVERRMQYLKTLSGVDGLQTRLQTLINKYGNTIQSAPKKSINSTTTNSPKFTQKTKIVLGSLAVVAIVSVTFTIFTLRNK